LDNDPPIHAPTEPNLQSCSWLAKYPLDILQM